jgi:poly(ADP-ribose) glycohydrolase
MFYYSSYIFSIFFFFVIHSISLDPDEDQMDNTVFDGLRQFISEMSELERDKFLNSTLKTICRYAKNLKLHRPPRGMNFSLQQNSDSVEFEVKFIAW